MRTIIRIGKDALLLKKGSTNKAAEILDLLDGSISVKQSEYNREWSAGYSNPIIEVITISDVNAPEIKEPEKNEEIPF